MKFFIYGIYDKRAQKARKQELSDSIDRVLVVKLLSVHNTLKRGAHEGCAEFILLPAND